MLCIINPDTIIMKFSSFNLKKSVINALTKLEYLETTPVQAEVIPSALKGASLVVQSETGSGKTHSFLVPIINNVKISRIETQAIIIAPTRELAKQTFDFARQISDFVPGMRVKLYTSGQDRRKDSKSSASFAHIVIGTPGRLKEVIITEHILETCPETTIVVDEGDMMMEMGYLEDIDAIISLAKDPQIMFFSATYPQRLRHSVEKYVKADKIIKAERSVATAKTVEHFALDYKHQDKNEIVKQFINLKKPYLMLIFCSKKEDVNKLYDYLQSENIKCGIIHGDLEDRQRKSMMKRIRSEEFNTVVCSDIAARGIDIEDVTVVLNYDLPKETEYYFHRAGRTGRINKEGECYTLYNVDSVDQIQKIQSLGVNFKWLAIKNSEITEALEPNYRKGHRKTKIDTELDREIKKATNKVRTSKVKPNYKKRIKTAKEKVVRKHRREMIKKDIRRQRVERYKEDARNGK